MLCAEPLERESIVTLLRLFLAGGPDGSGPEPEPPKGVIGPKCVSAKGCGFFAKVRAIFGAASQRRESELAGEQAASVA